MPSKNVTEATIECGCSTSAAYWKELKSEPQRGIYSLSSLRLYLQQLRQANKPDVTAIERVRGINIGTQQNTKQFQKGGNPVICGKMSGSGDLMLDE